MMKRNYNTYASIILLLTCIVHFNGCDGKKNCADGSDEANCPPQPPTPVTPLVIVPTPTDGCILPPHPPNGELKLVGSQNVPNSPIYEFSTIQLDCKRGYVLESGNGLSLCISGQWSPNLSKAGGCIPRT